MDKIIVKTAAMDSRRILFMYYANRALEHGTVTRIDFEKVLLARGELFYLI